jgi:YesN/AraC family two-component response regulator
MLEIGGFVVPYHILLVDDDPDFRSEFAETLVDDYRITQASGGTEALKILERPNDIDLVILDVIMPDVRGTTVLRKIKQLAPDLGVIILTGFSSKDVAIEALKGAADDYVEKPVQVPKIRQSIARLLQETRARGDITTGGVDGKIDRVKHFLEINYHKTVKLEDAAEAVGLSPKYLSRLFRERTRTGFNAFKFRVKIDKAKELLAKTGSSVNQISYALGYENPESFIRMFKRVTGKTPTTFRGLQRRRKHASSKR